MKRARPPPRISSFPPTNLPADRRSPAGARREGPCVAAGGPLSEARPDGHVFCWNLHTSLCHVVPFPRCVTAPRAPAVPRVANVDFKLLLLCSRDSGHIGLPGRVRSPGPGAGAAVLSGRGGRTSWSSSLSTSPPGSQKARGLACALGGGASRPPLMRVLVCRAGGLQGCLPRDTSGGKANRRPVQSQLRPASRDPHKPVFGARAGELRAGQLLPPEGGLLAAGAGPAHCSESEAAHLRLPRTPHLHVGRRRHEAHPAPQRPRPQAAPGAG